MRKKKHVKWCPLFGPLPWNTFNTDFQYCINTIDDARLEILKAPLYPEYGSRIKGWSKPLKYSFQIEELNYPRDMIKLRNFFNSANLFINHIKHPLDIHLTDTIRILKNTISLYEIGYDKGYAIFAIYKAWIVINRKSANAVLDAQIAAEFLRLGKEAQTENTIKNKNRQITKLLPDHESNEKRRTWLSENRAKMQKTSKDVEQLIHRYAGKYKEKYPGETSRKIAIRVLEQFQPALKGLIYKPDKQKLWRKIYDVIRNTM
jgi:hypothetical protein